MQQEITETGNSYFLLLCLGVNRRAATTSQASTMSVEDVRAVEARLAGPDRQYANELVGLIEICESRGGKAAVQLAAMQACRSLFGAWAVSGELVLRGAVEVDDDALAAYRAWMLRSYRRFVSSLCTMLASNKTAIALRLPALDSLVMLASVEARHARPGRADPAALDATSSAYRLALNALMASTRALPAELLTRLKEAHLTHLDASFYLLKHVRRVSRMVPPPSRPERLVDLLFLITPPSANVEPRAAAMLSMPPIGQGRGAKAADKAAEASRWPATARQLLSRQRHRSQFCKTWRSVLALPLPADTFRSVLTEWPNAIVPHVPVPLRYCDLLSDGYARGGVDAILALRGLFVLMTQYNLEYPQFYSRLYTLLTLDALCGPHRHTFAKHLALFLSSTGLPAYLLCAFVKRLARLALVASPSGAALGCALSFNVLLKHPSARVLAHRSSSVVGQRKGGEGDADEERQEEEEENEENDDDDDDDDVVEAGRAAGGPDAALIAAAAAADPFDETEADPEQCAAIDSSVWEIDQLRQHCCPTVASLAALFAAPMTAMTPPIDIEPLAALTYESLGELETRKKLKAIPLAVRTPHALFGTPPGAKVPSGMPQLAAGLGAWC